MRTYSVLRTFDSFLDRFNYLKLDSKVGEQTFGFDRYFNQQFYRSKEWKTVRAHVIARDDGCDLGIPGRHLNKIYIHHMNPIALADLENKTDFLLNPEYLICCSFNTHNAIHYGSEELLMEEYPLERRPNDTSPWKEVTQWKSQKVFY